MNFKEEDVLLKDLAFLMLLNVIEEHHSTSAYRPSSVISEI